MVNRATVLAGMLLPSLALAGAAHAEALPTAPYLPVAVAQQAASAALAACAGQGYRESVFVVDADGVPRAMVRGDGAGAHTLDSAFRKAYTAASFRAPTSGLNEMTVKNPEANGLRFLDHLLLAGGGLPIRVGDTLVGAIGAAGAPGFDKDEACAKSGIDAISDRLR